DAVRELRGERAREAPKPAPVAVELPVDAYIPDDYIGDRALKMNFYQRMANLERPEQAEAMVAELTDRFGTPPRPVAHLLDLIRLKTEAAEYGYEGVALRDGEVLLKLRRTVSADRVALYRTYRNDARVTLGEIHLPRRLFAADEGQWLAELRELLPLAVGAKGKATASPQAVATASAIEKASRANGHSGTSLPHAPAPSGSNDTGAFFPPIADDEAHPTGRRRDPDTSRRLRSRD
ncbi:MAG: TRCF domain-containing protein, partial [Ktedonobacterales bacterium]